MTVRRDRTPRPACARLSVVDVPSSLSGSLLVASPQLGDPSFRRTVVLLLEHTDEGALGVVLTRPGSIEVASVLPTLSGRAARPEVVFLGGPVQPEVALGLVRDGDRVGLVDLDDASDTSPVRVFAGYAGWSPQQLEGEIDRGDWFVVPVEPDDALGPCPELLWRAVLRRQGGRLAMLSTLPDDPREN